jgi:hypothetical protein
MKVISGGSVQVKLFRIEANCDVSYRFTIHCDAEPEHALTLGELRMIEDVIRDAIRNAEAAAGTRMMLEHATLFPNKRAG